MDTDSAPPYYAITGDNHSAWVIVTSVVFLVYLIMGVAAKIALRINLTSIRAPDICLMAGLVSHVYECPGKVLT